MMDLLPQFSANDIALSELSVRLLIVLSVMLIEQKFAVDASYHPGTLWRHMALIFSKKTGKGSKSQQRLAGVIASFIMLFIGMSITIAILYFATYTWFFEVIFLLLAINSNSLLTHCRRIYHSLRYDKKNLAREQLNQICVRDTHALSSMGIVKGTIEGAVQKFSLHYVSPILIYLLFGPFALVSYGLIYSLSQHWNPKKQKFREFGLLPSQLMAMISLLFNCLSALLIGLLFGIKHLSLKRNSWHRYGAGALLTTTANAMNRELGGAVMYDKLKIRRPKLGTRIHPENSDLVDLVRLIKKLRQTLLLLIALLAIFSLII
ncbi:cobalamin biosynthesis protein [Psychrobium sp. MM17-31]|uniref:cobalamin biosynthesis protein CobD/CbiB n=1 Tax=Psychrobium sp. MM17-31 TaxID=2917758 RepID=UPI001EF5FC47|nr:cobalamin biosynthesis protein [Psychrobium sp. MM17-31]MCG7531293.1 cobalamin biosynthesis protein [Psychrobium sp. MM17-31]